MNKGLKVLVTGGTGYIGSHTCVELLNANFDVVVIDNLSNSSEVVIDKIREITGKNLEFIQGDIRDTLLLDDIFLQQDIDAVIHFAGLKAVGESQSEPLMYFDNNISGSISLVKAMKKAKVFNLVFSSSATVYGNNRSPLTEDMPTGIPSNNYGYTKLIIEQILKKESESEESWSVSILRYFNPIGAHKSGLIGEDPKGCPNNLMPYITQVAACKRAKLFVYGNDYETPDGTGIRDYVHVVDLAKAHVLALKNRLKHKGCLVCNIGSGQGFSVLELIKIFEKVNNIEIPYSIVGRREGDIDISFADNTKAYKELGWKPILGLDEMLQDSWKWQRNNPDGHDS